MPERESSAFPTNHISREDLIAVNPKRKTAIDALIDAQMEQTAHDIGVRDVPLSVTAILPHKPLTYCKHGIVRKEKILTITTHDSLHWFYLLFDREISFQLGYGQVALEFQSVALDVTR